VSDIDPKAAAKFLDEMALYWERLPTKGEDATHWAHVTNAEACRKISAHLRRAPVETPS
jgi:hypothetical protein